jgi:hypothetical protein
MLRASIAAFILLSACGKKDAPPAQSAGSDVPGSDVPGSAGSGSAMVGSVTGPAVVAGSSSASGDPWSKPAPTPSPDAPCNDDDIKKHIDESLTISLAYLDALEKKTAKWGKDCEQAKKDLIALEPDATKFMGAMRDFVSWAQTLGPKCAARVQELGDKMAAARDIEMRTPGLEAKIKPILEKCKDHPGFNEAAAKGLRVMHRKKAP